MSGGLSPGPGGLVSPELVGRAAEVEQLRATVSAPPAVVLLEGEPGIGKTRLVCELGLRVSRPILVGQCAPIQEPFPLGPVLEVARQLLDVPTRPRLSPLAGALRPLLPELADRLPPALEPLDDRAAERHRVFRALAELLRAVGPAVVVLEDLHWCDEHTLEFLRYILSQPPARLSWVLTFRDEDAGPRVREATARLPAPLRVERLALTPLDVTATGRLAASIVKLDQVPRQFATHLCERTGGLPFAIEEVVALLRARGLLGPQGVVWPAAAESPVPAAVRDHVRQRAHRLPRSVRPVLEALAVLQRPVPVALVAALCDAHPDRVAAQVSLGMEAGLLVEHDLAVGYRHSLARQAVYEGIPGPRRRRWHQRAAMVLAGSAAPPLGQLAHHLRQAGELPRWALVAEQAADQAAAVGHDDEASRLLAEVLQTAADGRLALTDEQAGRLGIKLGRVAMRTLRLTDISGPLAAVLRRTLAPRVRVELEFLLGAVYDRIDASGATSRELFRSAAQHPLAPADLRAWARVALEMRSFRDSYASQRRSLWQVYALLPAVADPDLEVFLRSRIVMMFLGIGDPGWREHAVAVQRRVGCEPRRSRQVSAYEGLAEQACYVGHYQVAARLLPAALAGARACEDRRVLACIQAAKALLDYCRGDWDGLEETAAALYDELVDEARIRCRVEVIAGGLALARGDLGYARQRLEALRQRLQPQDGADVLPTLLGPLLRVYLAQGDTDAALALVDWCLPAQADRMLWPAMARALPWLVRTLLVDGRVEQATALVDRYATDLRGRDAPLLTAGLHHARGHLAGAGGDPARAAWHLRAAAAHYAALPARYDAALAAEDAALALLSVGDRTAAAALLRDALGTFTDLGATRDVTRAAGPARRLRVPVPAPHRGGHHGYGQQLSPREREVAALAATGQTNKEIAAHLFVSVETVKKHLQAAMRKLSVRSRTALAHRLATDNLGDGPGAGGPVATG